MTCAKVSELKMLNETLTKENMAKDREIRQLNKDAQSYEQTIMNLRKEMSNCKYHTPEVSMKDAEVMAASFCMHGRWPETRVHLAAGWGGPVCGVTDCARVDVARVQCGEWEPVKDFSELLRDETLKYQERVHKMEANLKASGDSIRALRKVNVSLTEEMHSLRRVCAALDEQCRAANMRAQFKDDIIKEMRRQLKQAKAKVTMSRDR
ncbi:hypothetical protein PYW07_000695 [Mythimna separata]|uniref:Uncharacterized protein n=1 Tax=Mythimna separata TaxID=271217 RepID=A0AAD8DW25_MYTSE|nr:hypothetical protein PYW07_000695 [Mythimna separata]